MGLPEKIKRELQYNGLRGLLSSVPQYFQKQLRGLPYFYARRQVLEGDELKQYCVRNGNRWEYDDGCQVTITTEQRKTDEPERFQQMAGTYQVDPSYVFELPNAKLLGEHGVAFTENNDMVLDSTRGKYTKLHNAVAAPSFPSIRTIRGLSQVRQSDVTDYDCVFPLVLPKTTFFVWIVEYLPKLQAWEQYTRQTGRHPTVVLWPEAPSWMLESVKLLGVEDIIYERFDVLHADRVVLGTHRYHNVGIDYNPHCPSEYRWLSERMREAVRPHESASKIYISRADASRRRVMNEPALHELLDSYGFKRVTLADKPFAEQVRALAGAEVILSLHGAGLAHLLWAEDPTVIEIVPDTYQRPTFFCLTQVLDIDYEPVIAETTDTSVPPKERDVRVDVRKLEDALERVV